MLILQLEVLLSAKGRFSLAHRLVNVGANSLISVGAWVNYLILCPLYLIIKVNFFNLMPTTDTAAGWIPLTCRWPSHCTPLVCLCVPSVFWINFWYVGKVAQRVCRFLPLKSKFSIIIGPLNVIHTKSVFWIFFKFRYNVSLLHHLSTY